VRVAGAGEAGCEKRWVVVANTTKAKDWPKLRWRDQNQVRGDFIEGSVTPRPENVRELGELRAERWVEDSAQGTVRMRSSGDTDPR